MRKKTAFSDKKKENAGEKEPMIGERLSRRDLLRGGVVTGAGLTLSACTLPYSPQTQGQNVENTKAPQTTVQIIIYPGFEVIDALAPFDVFHLSQRVGATFQTSLVTLDGTEAVTSLGGVSVKTTGKFTESGDILFIPGCGLNWEKSMPKELPTILQQWHREGKMIASDCTGVMLVAMSGLLKGRNANTHHLAIEALRKQGANVVNARVVDDGDIITSGGITSGIDLGIWMIERFFGPKIALSLEQMIEYERRGTVWRR